MTPQTLSTEFSDENQSPGLALWRVTNAWQAAQRSALKPLGLTHVQFVLLASLTWLRYDKPVTQKELAEHARIDPMMTSQVIRTLEQMKWVRRDQHPTDGRARALCVTTAGARLANRAVVVVETVDRQFFGALKDGGAALTRDLNSLLASREPEAS